MKESIYMGVEQQKEINEQSEQKERREKLEESPFFEIVNEEGEAKKICKGVFYEKEPNRIGKICESLVFEETEEFLMNMKSLFEKVLSRKSEGSEKQKVSGFPSVYYIPRKSEESEKQMILNLRNFENETIKFRIDLKDRIKRAIVDGIADEDALRDTNTLGLIVSAASLELKNILENIVENKDKKSEKEQEEEIDVAFLKVNSKVIKSIERWIFKDLSKELRTKFFRSKEEQKIVSESDSQSGKEELAQIEIYSEEDFLEGVWELNKETEKNIKEVREKELNPFFEIADKETGKTAKIYKGLFFDKEFEFINDLEYIFGEREEWKKWTGEEGRESAQKYLEDFSANMEKLSFSLKERTDRAVANGIADKIALENAYQLSILAMMTASELRDVFVENVFGKDDNQDNQGKPEKDTEKNKKERIKKKMEDSILRVRRKFIRSVERIIIKSEGPEFSGMEKLEFPDSEGYKWLKMFVGKEAEEKKTEDDFEANREKEYYIDKDVFFVEEGKIEYDEFLKGPSARVVYREPEKEKKEENLEQTSDAEFEDYPEKSEPGKNEEEKPLGSEASIKAEAVLEDKKLEGRNFYLIGHINQNLDRFKDIVDGIFKSVFTKRDTNELFRDYKKSLSSLREDLLIFNVMLPERIEKARKEYKKEKNKYGKKTLDEEAMETTELLAKFFSSWIENIRIDMIRYVAKDPKMDVGDITNEYVKETDKLRQAIGQFVMNIEFPINSRDLAIIDLESGSYNPKLDSFVFFDNTERLAMEIKDNAEELMKRYKDLRKTDAYRKACEKVGMIIRGEDDVDFREMIREKKELKEKLGKLEKEEDSVSFKKWKKECEEKLKRMPKKKGWVPSADIGEFSDMGEIRPKKEGLKKATDEERINALRHLSIEIYLKKVTFTARYYINSIETLYRLVGELDPDSENRKMFKVIKKDIQDVQPPNEEIKDLHEGFVMRLKELLKEITSATEKKAKRNMAEAEQEESTEEKPKEEAVKKEWYEVGAGKYKDFADKFKNISGELQKIPSYVSETEAGKIDWKKEKSAMRKEAEIETQAAEEKLKEVWPSEEKISERYENLTKNLEETVKEISQAEEKESVNLYLRSVEEASDIEKKLKPTSGYVGLVDYLDTLKHLENIENLSLEIDRNSAGIVESEIEIYENSKILEEMEKRLKEKQKKEKALDSEINKSDKDIIEFKDKMGEIKKKIEEAKEKIEEAKRKMEEAKSKMEKARAEIKNGKEEVEKIREKAKKKTEKMSGEIEKTIGKFKKEIGKFKPDKNKLEKCLKNISEEIAKIEMPKTNIIRDSEIDAYFDSLGNARKKADNVYYYLLSLDSGHIKEEEKNEIKKMIINQIEKPIDKVEEELRKIYAK